MSEEGSAKASTESLAWILASLDHASIDADTLATAKRGICDTLANMASAQSGADAPLWGRFENYTVSQGGHNVSSVFPSGTLTAPTWAAMLNGASAHLSDFDDVYLPGLVHVFMSVVPSALAAAESMPVPVSGIDLLTAVVGAGELICRLGEAASESEDMPSALSSQLFGYFGAAAATARILGLDGPATHSSLGLAHMQAAGTMEVVHSGTDAGKAYGAFCNQAGVQAALIASHGISMRTASIEGRAGILSSHYGTTNSAYRVTAGFGETYLLKNVLFKRWPSSLMTHPYILAGATLRDRLVERSVKPVRIRLQVGPWGHAFCSPIAERRDPRTSAQAKNSIPFALATALTGEDFDDEDLDLRRVDDSSVSQIAHIIEVSYDSELATPSGLESAVIQVETDDGRSIEISTADAITELTTPVSDEAIAVKLRRQFARISSQGASTAAEVHARIQKLEDEDDVRDLLPRICNGL